MEIVAIAAIDIDGWIGSAGKLPWHLPDDLKHFKELTRGKPVIMGRKTWDSLGGKPLPQRTNIVLTRTPQDLAGAVVVASVAEALAAAVGNEACIIGGAEIYALFFSVTTRMELTIVGTHSNGDTRFPAFDRSAWQCESSATHPADERHAAPFHFETWRRR